MNYEGINHLALATADMDRTVRFWRDLLGLRLVAGLGHRGYRQYFFEISDTDLLAFFEWPGLEPVAEKEHGMPVKGPFVFDHVSLGVSTEDDLWEVKDKLDAAGIWVSEVIDHGFIHSIYSFDPNGVPVEFSWNVPGADIRRRHRMADREPSEVTKEGSEPQADAWPAISRPTPRVERRHYPGDGQAVLGPKLL